MIAPDSINSGIARIDVVSTPFIIERTTNSRFPLKEGSISAGRIVENPIAIAIGTANIRSVKNEAKITTTIIFLLLPVSSLPPDILRLPMSYPLPADSFGIR